jgi:hypothetical protein
MLKRSLLLCGLTFLLVLVSSCLFDPEEKPPGDDTGDPIVELDLTQRWHVLNNIEFAYNNRKYETYDALLSTSPQFTFFFDDGDVGGEIPVQWDRASELDATGKLFRSNVQSVPPADPVCRSIKLDLLYDPNNIAWIDKIPELFPDETWHYATINYTFQFTMDGDLTYIQNDAKAQFTVRNAGTEAAPHWELVEFFDLGEN